MSEHPHRLVLDDSAGLGALTSLVHDGEVDLERVVYDPVSRRLEFPVDVLAVHEAEPLEHNWPFRKFRCPVYTHTICIREVVKPFIFDDQRIAAYCIDKVTYDRSRSCIRVETCEPTRIEIIVDRIDIVVELGQSPTGHRTVRSVLGMTW